MTVNPGQDFDPGDPTAEAAVAQTIAAGRRHSRHATAVGIALLAATGGLVAAEATGALDHVEFAYSVPFIPKAQAGIEAVDGALQVIGEGLVPLAGLALAGLSLAKGRRYSKIDSLYDWSSTELSDLGQKPTRSRRALRLAAAGTVPVLASIGAGVAVFSTSLGTAITNGPDKPIEAFNSVAPGTTYVVEYADAKPMVSSDISAGLVAKLQADAKRRGIQATPVNLHLGDIVYRGQDYTDLTLGLQTLRPSPITWDYSQAECRTVSIPVEVDPVSRIPMGANIMLDGLKAHVVGELHDSSAINRIGAEMAANAMDECIYKGPENAHLVSIDAPLSVAEQMLAETNTDQEAATVITQKRYIANSRKFWESNIKPITNVLSLVSLGLAGAAMIGSAGARLFRNRRQWAQKAASGMDPNLIRMTEMIRSLKEGAAATFVGVLGGTLASPGVGVFESALKTSVGPREWFVGASVGILGPVLGTAVHFVRPKKIIDKARDTRGA